MPFDAQAASPAEAHRPAASRPLKLAVIGAGPAGLTLALLARKHWPSARITVFDARQADKDVSGDPRALALSLGSVQMLQGLSVWPASLAQPILEVQVSQAPPTLELPAGLPARLSLRAAELGVPQLGAVLHYGQLVAPLQQAWQAACAASAGSCELRLGQPVTGLNNRPGGVEVDAGLVEDFDLAVVAEGGVFAEQARKAVVRDYQQNAWVGTVLLGPGAEGGAPLAPAGTAFERFTREGPVALLPLPARPGDAPGTRRASLVWCVQAASEGPNDAVADLKPAQRQVLLANRLPPEAGQLLELGPLKCFALGLNAERSLVQGRQVRIGNAAQTLHPVAGQGLNLGLRDAMVLVRSLREAIAGREDLDAALRRIEWSRAPDRWSMIAATDFLARSFTWQWPGLPALRGLGLAALQALPPLRAALARQMMFGRR